MRIFIYTILFISFILFSKNQSSAQGCVAIRSTGGVCTMGEHPGYETNVKHWLLSVNNRYFRSFRHFVGTEEQKQRIEQGTEVINHAYTLDLSLTRVLNQRWSLNIDLPVLANGRSSLYEHGGKDRHKTHSFGIGDLRLTAYRWLLNPASKGNIQAGLGIKLPTGDYRYQDYFYKADATKVLGPVDQSIQLGDGGTGFTTELNGYYNFSKVVSAYANIFYLFNPREQNGVSTARGGTPSATSITYGSDVMSVPDQYMLRGGVNLTFNKLTLSAGVRDECVPIYDLIGGSNGFRRPGYVLSAEPGVTYKFKNLSAYAYVPVALERSRTQSVPDKIRTRVTGTYFQGDAAFADYSVNVGIAVRF
ncbi:MAG: hypothetical protein ICV51_05540 [Flavisolibacter sp.]|nr:hypothetical protein [Flavisolibacter sp.]MBD0365772.1 hypothetical protein [Flavisolibacter sp.]MBD0375075.1 hypothetical protein [Flavisolibacter sp.]